MTETGDPARDLRILHVLRAPVGGLFRHVLDLTREQIARGFAVGLVTDSNTGGSRAEAILAELEPDLALGVKRLPMSRRPHPTDLLNLVRVEAHARRLKANVIHGHGSKGGLYARLPGLIGNRNKPIRCYTPHGGSFNQASSPILQSLYMGTERALAATTDIFLFESVYVAQRFHEQVGEPRALVRIVQNGIGPDEFVPVSPDVTAADFLYVGELRAAKGIDTLLDALALVARRLQRTPRLVLVGGGPDEAKLTKQAASLRLADHVSFAGVLPARKAFALGRVLIVPSRTESLPYIVLEAAGAQIPIVATNVGGIGEIFGPYRDRLIPCGNAPLLAETMLAMAEQDAAQRKAEAVDLADFVASRFSISVMTDSVIAGYREAFASRIAPAPVPDGRATVLQR